jgi:hypothetical protein
MAQFAIDKALSKEQAEPQYHWSYFLNGEPARMTAASK